jgi:hypothetical protein
MMLVKFTDFSAVVQLIIAVFVLYLCWDIVKIKEYIEGYKAEPNFSKRYGREGVRLLVLVLFIALRYVQVHYAWNRWLLWSLALFFTVFYRVNKEKPIWTRLGGGLRGGLEALGRDLSKVMIGR